MQTVLTLEVLLGLILALAFGGVIGFERERSHRPAGLRTHMLVCLGTCLFTIISETFVIDPSRIAAGVVAGIGFIGAGVIWVEKDKIQGVTTASSLWVNAAIGLTIGVGDYILAAVVTVFAFVVLASRDILKRVGIEKEQDD